MLYVAIWDVSIRPVVIRVKEELRSFNQLFKQLTVLETKVL